MNKTASVIGSTGLVSRFRPTMGEKVAIKMVLESQQSDPSIVVFRLGELLIPAFKS